MIPGRLQLWAVGVAQSQRASGGAGLAAHRMRQLSRMYGLEFEPLARAIEEAPSAWPRPPLQFENGDSSAPKFEFLTDECLLLDVDLSGDGEVAMDVARELQVRRGGILG